MNTSSTSNPFQSSPPPTPLEHFDLVILGGGITGAGIARQAQLQGLKTLLLEKNDFAFGTSSKSGKLIHGGLRYLKQGQWRLVWESCLEKARLLNIMAPQLVTKTSFYFPIFKSTKPGLFLTYLGMLLYWPLTFPYLSSFPKILSKNTFLKHFPFFKKKDLKAVLCFEDCKALDFRLVLETLKSFVQEGGIAYNYCFIKTQYFKEGRYYLNLSNEKYCTANCLIVAAGIWTPFILKELSLPLAPPSLSFTSGIHLTFSSTRLPIKQTMTLLAKKDQRPLYAVSWGSYILVGTTDVFLSKEELEKTQFSPSISKEDKLYILETLQEYFPELNLSFQDILSARIGIRPLVGSHEGKKESELSRDYMLDYHHSLQGNIVAITGGKLTTYRKMAEKTVNLIQKKFFPERKNWKSNSLSISLLGKNLNQSHKELTLDLLKIYFEEEWATTLTDCILRRSECFLAQNIPPKEIWPKIAQLAHYYNPKYSENFYLEELYTLFPKAST